MTAPARPGELDPALTEVRSALELRRAGRLEEAERRLRALVAQPVATAAARLQAYLELGKTCDRLGRRRDAQAAYRRILALTDDWSWREKARRFYRRPYRGA